MRQIAARMGDRIIATDTHIVMIPSPGGPVPTPLPHPFNGIIDGGLSKDVMIMGSPAAVRGSTATNVPKHLPQGGPFQKPPSDLGIIETGSVAVRINGRPAARNGDLATTCNDPPVPMTGRVVATGTVMIG